MPRSCWFTGRVHVGHGSIWCVMPPKPTPTPPSPLSKGVLARNGKTALSRQGWDDTLPGVKAGRGRPDRGLARQGVVSRSSQQTAFFPFRASEQVWSPDLGLYEAGDFHVRLIAWVVQGGEEPGK